MRAIARTLTLAATMGVAVAAPTLAQDFPPAGYAPLQFNRDPAIHVFQIEGVPWICAADSFCKQIRIEGVQEKDLAKATMQPLGFADRRYLLSFQHADHNKGQAVILSCEDDRCDKLDDRTGAASHLGTFMVRKGDRVSSRTAILRTLDERDGRAQILWCAESGCAELPVTRDNDRRLAFMGVARYEGRERIWLRDRAGTAIACMQTEIDVDDRLDCENTQLTFRDFPKAGAQQPAPTATNTEADQRALAAAINQALLADDVPRAEPLIADAVRRFPNAMATWRPFQQRLANIKANQARAQKMEEARQLVVEARRLANFGDFAEAERLLQEADRTSPGLADIAKARTEIAAMRAARNQRYRERYQFEAAIERAFAAHALWEAEDLIKDALRRFPNDPQFRADVEKLNRIRQQADWLNRVQRAKIAVTEGRRAMDRGDFGAAERQLAVADDLTPGLPEANQLRADLGRARARAQVQNEQLRLMMAAFEAAILGHRFDEAARLLDDGARRYPNRRDWDDQRRRLSAARGGDDRQIREQRERRERAMNLVTQARQAANQGDLGRATNLLNEADKLVADMPEVAVVRAEIERRRADQQRNEAEMQAITASIDAAIARRRFDDAERLLAEGRRSHPRYQGWEALSRRIAEARRAAAAAPPAAPAASPAAKPADAKPSAPPPAPAKPADAKPDAKPDAAQVEMRVRALVARARALIDRRDFDDAEQAVAEAEKLDPQSRDVVAVRAELEAAEQRSDRRRRRGRDRN